MNARGSDFPSNLGKSIFWKRGGRSLWCSPPCGPLGPDEEEPVVRCSSVSSLVCRVSTVVVNLVMRAARSTVVSSAIGGDADGGGGRGAGGVVEEDRLDRDTRLSRASTPKTAGPRLRSS